VAENAYQARLIKKLYRLFPGCEILKNDSGYRQGLLDLTILCGDKWAMLEVKAHANAKEQPNQNYFLEKFGKMSFAAKIYPENEEEVLAALQEAFSSRRPARVS
jgi:Holliday junction resolvase-like predicted endonuclease